MVTTRFRTTISTNRNTTILPFSFESNLLVTWRWSVDPTRAAFWCARARIWNRSSARTVARHDLGSLEDDGRRKRRRVFSVHMYIIIYIYIYILWEYISIFMIIYIILILYIYICYLYHYIRMYMLHIVIIVHICTYYLHDISKYIIYYIYDSYMIIRIHRTSQSPFFVIFLALVQIIFSLYPH